MGEERLGLGDGEGGHLADVLAADPDEERLLFQPGPLAGGAGHDVHEASESFAHGLRVGLPVAPLQVGDHPLEGLVVEVPAAALVVEEAHLFRSRTVEQHGANFLRQLPKGGAQIEVVVVRPALRAAAW